jgi:hypothetical protein
MIEPMRLSKYNNPGLQHNCSGSTTTGFDEIALQMAQFKEKN